MMNTKKNVIIASSALIMAILSAGCSAANERADAYYGYSSFEAPVSRDTSEASVSDGEPEASAAYEASGSDMSYAGSDSDIEYPDIVYTPRRNDTSSAPAPSSSSIAVSGNDSGITYPDIAYSAGQIGIDSAPAAFPSDNISVSGSASAIKQVCGLKSKVETDVGACIVDTYSDHNPYDVAYDYGNAYGAFVDACDWSLVFDADFYAKSFPLLAMQYHDDKSLLLEHFQTIGIHEGRQGSESFNVGAYKANCAPDIRSAFGDNYEGYYFYYMLNYASEKSVSASGSKLQQKTIMTALQAAELEGVNMYRKEVGVFEIEFDEELAAYANYRAYLNSHDGWKAHDWFRADDVVTTYIMNLYDAETMGENTATHTCREANCTSYECNHGGTRYEGYRTSKSHYEAMIAAKYDLIGTGNCYKASGVISQFDAFINL